MKRILRLGKKKREFSPNSSDNGSVHSMGYEIRDKDLGKVHKAASTGDVAKLKQLAKKTDMNQLDRESRTPLHIASANGHAEAVEFLAENNANVNLCDNQNMSPLMKAVQCQQDQCVEILLKHNADHKLVDLNGNTALHMAALIPSVPLAALLLEHKANINAQNKDGCTPLVLSVAENHTEMVEFLVNRGADLNAKDQLSRTPLMIAACNGQINFVQLLLESNADITITDEKGWTSDDYAVINGHHACSHLIVEHETKRRSFQTLSPLFPNKKKPPLSSGNTSHVVDRGLSLGGPAINKDVDEQHSLDESISRASAKCGVDNSWPSSQEEDSLDFSPKKHAKVNLKEFLNSSDKGKKKVISEPEKSWSDGDFEQKCNDRAQSNPVLSSALPHSGNSINAPPPSPCSFSNVPQMTSTPLHSTEKKEVTENAEENKKRANKICEQESIKHDNLMDAECIVGERNIPRVDVVNKTTVNGELKRDFLSELGLRDCADDEESMWDSEPSAAESPRKLPSGTNSSSSNVQNRALPLDYNEDTFYVPSFLRGPGSCKLSNLDRLIDQTGQASKGDAHQSLDEQAAVEPAQQLPEVNCSAIKNPDLMEELGLGDVDDIEVSSEWDSNSSASKSSSAHKQENISLKADPELISSTPLGETTKSLSPTDKGNHAGAVSSYQKPVLPYYRNLTPYPKSKLNKVQQLQGRKLNVEGNEDEDADDVSDWDSDVDLTHSSPSKSTNIQKLKIGNRSGFTQEPLDIQPGEANSESMKRAVSETSMDSPENDGKDQWPEAAITQYELLPNFADVVKQSENLDIFTALDERKCKDPTEMEFDELTQSSDTATDDVDSFTTGYRNASELIRQLDSFSIDSVSLVKLQNIFHEYERTIQRERSRCSRLADKLRQQEQEQGESRQGLEEMRSSKSTLELRQVELETDLHNFKFLLKQEQDKHRNLQMLYDKSREQLAKKDAEYRLGVEERQKLELTVRNMELEIRALNNSIKQLEEDNTEIQHVLSQERNARSMQESILSNYLCKHKEIEEENVRKLNMSNEALLQMTEMGSNREKELQLLSCSLQEEVKKLKLDLECSHQEASRFTEENEVLKERLEDLKQDLKLSEGTFTQSIFQYNSQLASLKAESTVSAAKLESERQAREKVEAEMQSTLERLNAALKEVENCQGSRVEAERVLKREKDSWKESLEKQLSDAATHRKANQSLSQQLARAETKANNLENECHRATLSLTEKNLLLESLQREREENRARLSELEATLQQEREQVSRTAAKQEATLQRLVQAQSEATLLRQQVDQAQNKGAAKERAAADAQERFSDLLAKLRADSDERVCVAEERCKELSNKNAELREQLTKQEQERNEREGGVRHMQQELADLLKKLSMSEASLEVNSRYRCDLEEEKLRMLKDMERFKAKLRESDEQHNQDINRIHDLKSALDDKEREVMASTQKLQETISNTASTENTIRQLEGAVQRLEIENARLEGATKQQMTKIEVLQKSAQEMAQQRNRLEELVSNLQGTRMSLEEQLSREVQKQSMLNNSAQNSQQLWEEEMKTRSRLGLRLAQLEKEKNELSGQVDCERKKVKKVVDLKKSVDLRLEQEMKRNNDLQKELFRLKNLVKMAKKQLRELEGIEPDCHGSSLLGEHRQQTEAAVERMKSRMEVLSQQLDREMLKCSQLEATNTELKDQLSSLKTSSHNHKLLEEEVAALRRKLGAGVMDQSQAEQFKKETEERARQEIMQKLDEVNLFLQTHAASQEALEQVKAANEASMRSQMEQRIRDLESELARVQSLQQERDSIKVELDRYRDLYSEELRLRKTLSSKLDRSKERLAEANTKLLAERQRSSSIMVSNLTNPSPDATLPNLATVGPLGKGLAFGGSSQKSKVEAYLAQIQSEMEKNISQELTKAATEIEVQSSRVSPVGSASGSLKNSSPSALATAQYLEMMKKSYNL